MSRPRTSAFNSVSGSSQHEISATASVAKPSAPITPGTLVPPASSASTIATMTTVTAALTMLFAAMIRERRSGALRVWRMA